MIEQRIYHSVDGKAPFEEWISGLRNPSASARIRTRIDRAGHENFGDYAAVGGGVLELRIHFGPGYRVYVGLYGEKLIILLCGGDKSTQDKNIRLAQEYWQDYRRRT